MAKNLLPIYIALWYNNLGGRQMILKVRVNNFMAFGDKTEFSMLADSKIKKFGSNVISSKSGFKAVKSACIYGANNAGKTCILRAVNAIKKVLLNSKAELVPNIFAESKICSLGVMFLHDEKAYSYDFSFGTTESGETAGFVYERFAELKQSKGGEIIQNELFLRDVAGGKFFFKGCDETGDVIKLLSTGNVLIHTMNSADPAVRYCYDILTDFARKIDVLTLDNIPIDKTIGVLKDNKELRDKTVELIKLADLDIDDYKYLSNETCEFTGEGPRELALSGYDDDMYRLASVKGGKAMQSFLFDSTGTKKLIALSSYIVEALEKGKILVVDELDSSLHFKLTRAIVALFNNELSDSQLIFTAHDINLLDCKKLFRFDQIWFASKVNGNAVLYPLTELIDSDNRGKQDFISDYKMGLFGALPRPNFIDLLIKNTVEDDDDDE